MKKTAPKTLRLAMDTIRQLSGLHAEAVHGGRLDQSARLGACSFQSVAGQSACIECASQVDCPSANC